MKCPTCDKSFDRLGTHLRWNPNHRPDLDEFQRDLMSFLALVGIGVDDRGDHPRLKFHTTDRELAEAVSDALGWLAKEPRLHREAASDVERDSDVWRVTTVPHPSLGQYTSPESVTSLTTRLARWLVLGCGEWIANGPFGSLHLDTRGMKVSGDHLRDLLRDAGVDDFCPDSKWPESIARRGHWRDDVVALPDGWGKALVDAGGLDLGDVEHTGRLKPVDAPKELETDLVT